MVKAQIPSFVHGQGSAKTHPAVAAERIAAQQIQINHLEEILIPADGDAIFRNSAETEHDALVQILVQFIKIVDRLGWLVRVSRQFLGQRLDFQAVDAHHAETFIEQIV